MYLQTKIKTSDAASWIIAIVAMGLLLTYIADAALQMTQGTRFLPLTELERGRVLGIISIILFFAAFGVGLSSKSRITSVILIAGGFMMSKSVLAALVIYGEQLEAVTQTFIGVAIIGYIIVGLGIWQMVSKRKYNV
jgi:hypothetical protein